MKPGKRTVPLGTIELRPDGILHTVVDFTEDASEADAAEYLQSRDELTAGTNPPVLVEIRATAFVERSIREFLMSGRIAAPCRAVVARDPSIVTIWKSFELVDNSGVPTKMFSSVPRAVEWIHDRVKAAAEG
jgi:hypothetical protein